MVCKVNPDGFIDWATPCRESVKGSYSQTITVKSHGSDGNGYASHLYFSGNPSKFLQGHNIFGSDDLIVLMEDTYRCICQALSLTPLLTDLRKVRAGDYSLTRVDINYSYELPCRSDVLAWLRAAEFKCKTRHGRASSKGGTLYWGKTSKRWSLKAYSKGEEIQVKGHKLPDSLLDTPLTDWADNKLRIEVVLRNKELEERSLRNAGNWTESLPRQIYNEYIARLDMTEQIALSDEHLFNLPQRLRSTYVLWKDGHDLRQESMDCTNVVPLIRVLEAVPAEIPSWAFDQKLIHSSALQTPMRGAV